MRWFQTFKIPFSLLFHILFSLGFFYQDLGLPMLPAPKVRKQTNVEKKGKTKCEATNMAKADIINLLGWRCQKCFFRVTRRAENSLECDNAKLEKVKDIKSYQKNRYSQNL